MPAIGNNINVQGITLKNKTVDIVIAPGMTRSIPAAIQIGIVFIAGYQSDQSGHQNNSKFFHTKICFDKLVTAPYTKLEFLAILCDAIHNKA